MNDTIIKGGRGICGAVLLLLSLVAGGCMSGGSVMENILLKLQKNSMRTRKEWMLPLPMRKQHNYFTMGNLSEAPGTG